MKLVKLHVEEFPAAFLPTRSASLCLWLIEAWDFVESIWSFSLSFTSCNPTTMITNQFFSDGSKFAVLGQTVRVCYKYIDCLTGFLCPHVELCTFEDHVSLDDEMLIEFLFHFGIVRLVSLRESRTMTMSFASLAMQYIIVFICRGCWVRSICDIAWSAVFILANLRDFLNRRELVVQ